MRRRDTLFSRNALRESYRSTEDDGSIVVARWQRVLIEGEAEPYLTFYFCIALQGVFRPRG